MASRMAGNLKKSFKATTTTGRSSTCGRAMGGSGGHHDNSYGSIMSVEEGSSLHSSADYDLPRLIAEAGQEENDDDDDNSCDGYEAKSNFSSSNVSSDGQDGNKLLLSSKRWNPSSTTSSRGGFRRSGLLSKASSFTNRGKSRGGGGSGGGNLPSDNYYTNHSSHPLDANGNSNHLSNLLEEETTELRRNSDHDECLTDTLKASSKDGMNNPAEVARMLRQGTADYDDDDDSVVVEEEEGGAGRRPRLSGQARKPNSSITSKSSSVTNDGDNDSVASNELDDSLANTKRKLNSDAKTILESLGPQPTSSQLAHVAAVRAKEYIEELCRDVSLLDREQWDCIPQYSKADLLVGQYLGKGTFSDAFEVIADVEEEESKRPTRESFGRDREDLDKLMEKRFSGSINGGRGNGLRRPSRRPSIVAENDGDSELDQSKDTLGKSTKSGGDHLDKEIEAMFGKQKLENLDKSGVDKSEDLDREIEALFGGGGKMSGQGDKKTEEASADAASGDDLDKEIEAMFGSSGPPKTLVPIKKPTGEDERPKVHKFNQSLAATTGNFPSSGGRIQPSRRAGPSRRQTSDLGSSVCLGTQSRITSKPKQSRKVIMAMKCLRPQIRSDAEQFMIGVEDLVHETAMLASLDHPNIIKLHGRAGGCVSNSFRLSEGYFILLDRLKDTLDDRIGRWKKTLDYKRAPPNLSQIKTAVSLADAISHLHSRRIVFRDLKPANVGFDGAGVLKLFDFGFAKGVEEEYVGSEAGEGEEDEQEDHLLYDKCGTPRYMAPEVGLEMGYSLPADVYSFGILLWEICALKKPFGHVKSANEFYKIVHEKGARPKLNSKVWPRVLSDLMLDCWSTFPEKRPEMSTVKSLLAAHAREVAERRDAGNGGVQNSFRKSMTFRRFTG